MMIAALFALAAASVPIEGAWKSPGGNSIIAIAPCGPHWCGTVAWASAKAKQDARKTTTQLVGTRLLTQLRQRRDGSWIGRIFIPDRNMHLTAKIRLQSPRQLKVSGCAAGKAMCKSTLWTRVDGPVPASD